jgi:hypothetical protein
MFGVSPARPNLHPSWKFSSELLLGPDVQQYSTTKVCPEFWDSNFGDLGLHEVCVFILPEIDCLAIFLEPFGNTLSITISFLQSQTHHSFLARVD